MPKFEKGNHYSTGRQPGSRNKSTLWFEKLDALGSEGAEKLIRVVQAEGEKGDMHAASIMLSRAWPRRRGRPVVFDLPVVDTTAGLVEAHARVVAAMAQGTLTPDEAAAVASVLENQRRAIEINDHEERLRALEAPRSERRPWEPQELHEPERRS